MTAPTPVRPLGSRGLAHLTHGDGVTLCGLRAVGWAPAREGDRPCAACARAWAAMGRVGKRLRKEARDGGE